MCCVPCGPRRSCIRFYDPNKITKKEVLEIITNGSCLIEIKGSGDKEYTPYNGAASKIKAMLRDRYSAVHILPSFRPQYLEGFMTIELDNSIDHYSVLIREKKKM